MVGDWLSLPALVGCIQSGSAPVATPSIAITQITFQTKSYGTTLAANPTSIGVSDRITTVLTPVGNAATIPTEGLAQYYENGDASKQVFHTMQVNYTATNFSITDLPADGGPTGSKMDIITSLGQAPAASQLNTWVLEGSPQGQFFPTNAKTGGVIMGVVGATRAQVFETSPVVGDDNIPLDNGVEYYTPGNLNEIQGNLQVNRLDRIAFAAQNLSSSSTMGIAIKVFLDDGTEVTSPTVTITIPADGVKTNIIGNPVGINSYTTTTAAYGIQYNPNPGAGDAQAFPGGEVMVSALNAGNSFTTPNADPGSGIGMVMGYDDPANQVLHSWQANLDTSTLTLSDFPATGLIVQYHFTWNADATNITPNEDGILWDAETGEPSAFTTSDDINFTQVAEQELDLINTNTLIPLASVDFPIHGDVNYDFNSSWKAYSPAGGVGSPPSYSVNLQVKIQKTDGSFVSSPITALTIMNEDGVMPTRI